MTTTRTRSDQVRDLIMIAILGFWTIYAAAAVGQLFTSGARVLESLPPFWFWGVPLGPYGALYGSWPRILPGATPPPEPPTPVAPTPSEPTA